MKIDVLAIGELLADLISTEYVNDISEVKKFEIFQGGSPANLCANLKWLGTNAELIACVGADSVGSMLLDNLAQVGLPTDKIAIHPEYPSSLVLVGKSKGSPDFIAYRMADSQILSIDKESINDAQIIHTSAFALSKEPARASILTALRFARQQGKDISCDWNFAQKIWQQDNGIAVFNELCSLKPLLKLSLDDMKRFLNNENASIQDVFDFLGKYPTSITCLTLGSEGVWYSGNNQDWFKLDAVKVNQVKDTTGAGDAFWAAFLNAKLQGLNITDCVEAGIQFAAKKIQTVGPIYISKPIENLI